MRSRTLLPLILLWMVALLHAQNWGSPVWSSEFNGAAGAPPNPQKWTYDLGAGGWGNNELETYTNDPANVSLDGNGHLVITAIDNNGSYTSARIKTEGLYSFQYGRAEARIQLPWGKGLWPAFWMLGTSISSAGWPTCGEMDIMESVDVSPLNESSYQASIHAAPSYNGGQPTALPAGGTVDGEFHTYGVIWSPGLIQYYVDDPTNIVETFTPAANIAYWPFDDSKNPFFFILNLAVGGSWPGSPDSTTPFPAKMLVDYVRVYQAASFPGPAMSLGNMSVTAGNTASSQIQLSGTAGTGAVYLKCTGAPTQAACSISPNVVNFNQTASGTATLSITTTAASRVVPAFRPPNPWVLLDGLAVFGVLGMGLILWRRRWAGAAGFAMLLWLAASGFACGGGSSGVAPSSPPPPVASGGTPAGNYTITVTAINESGTSSSATATLTVN